jgi:hypothetical protein
VRRHCRGRQALSDPLKEADNDHAIVTVDECLSKFPCKMTMCGANERASTY